MKRKKKFLGKKPNIGLLCLQFQLTRRLQKAKARNNM